MKYAETNCKTKCLPRNKHKLSSKKGTAKSTGPILFVRTGVKNN